MLGRRIIGLALLATAAVLAGYTLAQGPKPLSESLIGKLIELQLGDDAIVAKLQKDGIDFAVDGAVVGRLKAAGASEAVLEAVRKAGRSRAGAPSADAKPVTYADILLLLQSGIDERTVLGRLEKSPTVFTLDAGQVDELKKAGASPALLEAMQGKRSRSPAGGEVTELAIILDCSGSMMEKTRDGQTKMDVARRVVADLIKDIPRGMNLAFIIYGHEQNDKCEAVKVVRPLSLLDNVGRATLVNMVRTLPAVGATPIALALETAGRELAKGKGASGLVLISDGKETCRGNPTEVASRLARDLNLTFGVNVIGFDVETEERASLEEIARAGKGKYQHASNALEFRKAIVALHKELDEVAPKRAPAPRPAPAPKPKAVVIVAEPDRPINDPTAQALIENLTDGDGAVRRAAAESLNKLGDRSAVPALMKRIADDVWIQHNIKEWSDPFAGGKGAALEALKKLEPDKTTQALAAATRSKDDYVRTWAATELGNQRDELAFGILLEALNDKYGAARRAAAESLGKLGDRAAVPALMKRIADDVWIQHNIKEWSDPFAGGKGAALETLRTLEPEKVIPALAAATRSKAPYVKAWAATELGKAAAAKPE